MCLRVGDTRRSAVFVEVVGLFLVVSLLRWLVGPPGDAVVILYTIPVVLLGARLGLRAGLLAALAAVVLMQVMAMMLDIRWAWVTVTSRAGVFLAVGTWVGWFADRLSSQAEEHHELQTMAVDLGQRARRAQSLQDLLAQLSRAATPQEVAEVYLDAGRSLLGFSRGGVFVVDASGRSLRLVAVHQPVESTQEWQSVSLEASTPPTDAVRTSGANYQRDEHEIVEAYPHLAPTRESSGDRAWVAVPMIGLRGVHGAITAAYAEPRAFGATERELFGTVAGRIAEAMERARLLEETAQAQNRAEEAERRASLLAEVGIVLTGDLRSTDRMQRLLELLVPVFADCGTVEVVSGPRLELLAAVHAEPARVTALRQWRRHEALDPRGRGVLERAVRAGTPLLVTDLAPWESDPCGASGTSSVQGEPAGPAPAACGEQCAGTDRGTAPTCSALALPLRARGEVIGGLLLVRCHSGRTFDQAESALGTLVAGRAALALDNARLYERQRDVAATLQQALLPDVLPKATGVTASARYRPGESTLDVGGDWYDLIVLPGDRVGIVLGDVVGRGVAAAATMGRLRSAVAAIAPDCAGPAAVMQRLDRFAESVPGASLATVAYADFEPTTGLLRFACAGHPPPLLLTDTADASFLRGGRNVPLATGSGLPWQQDQVVIDDGAILICYSDGLVERRRVDLQSRFDQLARSAAALRGRPLDAMCEGLLLAMAGGQPLDDDVALLCLRLERVAPSRFAISVPARPDQLVLVRGRLRAWASGAGLNTRQIGDLLLACGEACANAIEHAYRGGTEGGTVEVDAERLEDGSVVVRVTDSGRWAVSTGPSPDRGRGLALMRATMRTVDVEVQDSGTTVVLRTLADSRAPCPVEP